MKYSLNKEKLAKLIKVKRVGKSLRDVTDEIGVSPSTLSRVERGSLPDMDTFLSLCDWLDVAPREFFSNGKKEDDTVETIAMLINKDEKLPDELKESLIKIIKATYEYLT